jgi:hypothetical protein
VGCIGVRIVVGFVLGLAFVLGWVVHILLLVGLAGLVAGVPIAAAWVANRFRRREGCMELCLATEVYMLVVGTRLGCRIVAVVELGRTWQEHSMNLLVLAAVVAVWRTHPYSDHIQLKVREARRPY